MRPKKVYWAGELFSLKHLQGNLNLSRAVSQLSDNRYTICLPQDLEFGAARAKEIRDLDLQALISSHLAVFNFDGNEIDSGTLVEFIFAKIADIPSVIVRSDFRSGGDNTEVPWNLMAHGYPRTEVVLMHAMNQFAAAMRTSTNAVEALAVTQSEYAERIYSALLKVEAMPPLASKDDLQQLAHWLPRCIDASSNYFDGIRDALLSRASS